MGLLMEQEEGLEPPDPLFGNPFGPRSAFVTCWASRMHSSTERWRKLTRYTNM
jgi:hypothetical protein